MVTTNSPHYGTDGTVGPKHSEIHVVPFKLLLGIGVALLILTYATVAATYWDFGYTINLVVALAIAVVKAALVMLFFMHLRWDNPFNAMWAIGALLFISIFIVATISDSSQYGTNYVPPGPGTLAPK